MKMKSERGAIIVEATIALSFFMFAIVSVLLFYRVAMAQARIGSALNATAKEIAEYGYIYELTGLNEKQRNISSKGEAAGKTLNENLSDIGNLYDAFKGLSESAKTITSSSENTESFLYYLLNQGIEAVKGQAVGFASKIISRKHFGSSKEAADAYLKSLGVVDGYNGLRFGSSSVFKDGVDKNVTLVVSYKIRYLRLFNYDLTKDYTLCAKTRAWVGAD